MSRLERAAVKIMQDMHADVSSAVPVVKAAGGGAGLRDALLPYACQIAVAEKNMRAVKKLTKVLKALLDDGPAPAKSPKPAASIRDQVTTAEALRSLAQVQIPKVNGHDLHREVRRGEVPPPWHPEA